MSTFDCDERPKLKTPVISLNSTVHSINFYFYWHYTAYAAHHLYLLFYYVTEPYKVTSAWHEQQIVSNRTKKSWQKNYIHDFHNLLGFYLLRIPVRSVEILGRKIRAIIANNDAIWVHHWDDFKDVFLTEVLRKRKRKSCVIQTMVAVLKW